MPQHACTAHWVQRTGLECTAGVHEVGMVHASHAARCPWQQIMQRDAQMASSALGAHLCPVALRGQALCLQQGLQQPCGWALQGS